MIDPSLEEFIKCEPRHSPFSMAGGSISPNPYLSAPPISPQPGSSFQMYRPRTSPERTSPMPPIYNIPLNQYSPNLQNRYEFPETIQADGTLPMDNTVQDTFMETPSPLQPFQQIVVTNITLENDGGVIYRAPNELTLRNEVSDMNVLDLDNQQYFPSEMHFGTSEILNAVLDDNKLSEELNQGLQITDRAPEPDQPSAMTDSLTRLTRDIQSLNEMCKQNHQN